MHLTEVTSRIFYLPGEEETDRPFLYYIKGDNYSVAVDAGNSREHVMEFYNAIEKAGMPLPEYTLITHWHWDHTFGLPYIQGKSIANQMTKEKLDIVSNWKWTLKDMKEREMSGEDISFCNECIKKEYKNLGDIRVQTVDTGIREKTVLDLGGIHVELMPMDSTHSRDAMLIYIPEEKALFIGDADCEDHYDNGGKYDPDRFRTMRKKIEEIDLEYYLLGHDMPDNKEGVIKYFDEIEGTL